jgi:hypothetical protein
MLIFNSIIYSILGNSEFQVATNSTFSSDSWPAIWQLVVKYPSYPFIFAIFIFFLNKIKKKWNLSFMHDLRGMVFQE